MFIIEKNTSTPFIRQIYDQIRIQILGGQLPEGDKLPSTREMAAHLGVSRNVVIEAYDLLLAEGYLVSRHGAGTFVTHGITLDWKPQHPPEIAKDKNSNQSISISVDFRSGIPELNTIPQKRLARLAYQAWLDSPHSTFSYGAPQGELELRVSIANYLMKTRGTLCNPENIIITSGSVQGLSLISQLLMEKNFKNTIIIEDPSNKDIRKIFTLPENQIIPVPVDQEGLMTEFLPKQTPVNAIQVTPSHQYPLGGILPIRRRLELIRYAQNADAFIIEDDYDSEFRYEGPPVSPLQSLAPDRVIYLGTFSKILFPSLRLGYMILPENLLEIAKNIKRLSDIHSNSQNQLILAEFIRDGGLERHISRVKKIYRKRRDKLIECLNREFSNQVEIWGQSTGLHLVAAFKKIKFETELLSKIIASGVKVYPVDEHAFKTGDQLNKLIFGYGHLPEDVIEDGVKKLALIIRQ